MMAPRLKGWALGSAATADRLRACGRKGRRLCEPRPAHGTVGTRNSPDPCRAVRKAGSLPARGRKAPHIGSLRRCLPAVRAGGPLKDEQRLLLAARVDVAPGGTMTQLARPDLARNRSGRDHARPGPASATDEPWPADRLGLLRAGRPVPGWAVGTAFLAPVVLVGGWLIAGALQPASYSPMRQTMSVLAGHSRPDRW